MTEQDEINAALAALEQARDAERAAKAELDRAERALDIEARGIGRALTPLEMHDLGNLQAAARDAGIARYRAELGLLAAECPGDDARRIECERIADRSALPRALKGVCADVARARALLAQAWRTMATELDVRDAAGREAQALARKHGKTSTAPTNNARLAAALLLDAASRTDGADVDAGFLAPMLTTIANPTERAHRVLALLEMPTVPGMSPIAAAALALETLDGRAAFVEASAEAEKKFDNAKAFAAQEQAALASLKDIGEQQLFQRMSGTIDERLATIRQQREKREAERRRVDELGLSQSSGIGVA